MPSIASFALSSSTSASRSCSLVVAGSTTLLCITLGALCAYAVARLRFRGRTLLLAGVLAISVFPQVSIVAPDDAPKGIDLAPSGMSLQGGCDVCFVCWVLAVIAFGFERMSDYPLSFAVSTAAVRAVRGRIRRSMGGSSARLMNMTTLPSTPEDENSSSKNLASA